MGSDVVLTAFRFRGSVLLHAAGGSIAYDQEQTEHGQSPVGFWGFLGTSQFWFQSFQNWQSEFMGVTAIVVASVWLREGRSRQSKPVAAPARQTSS